MIMKKVLTLILFLCVLKTYAQEKTYVMKVWKNGISTTYNVQEVDSVTFCEEETLEEEPSIIVGEESIWQDEKQVKAALLGVYSKVAEAWSLTNQMCKNRIEKKGEDGITPVSLEVAKCWEGYYSAINMCNTILSNEVPKNIKEQVIVLRAFCYTRLVNLFGDVPYRTKAPGIDMDDFYVARDDQNKILSNCAEELKGIVYNMPVSVVGFDDTTDVQSALFGKNEAICLLMEIRMMQHSYENTDDREIWDALWDVRLQFNGEYVYGGNSRRHYEIIKDYVCNNLDYTPSTDSFPSEQCWMLLKKYGNISDVLGENTYKALFPIPDREVMMNPYLTQNPGYSR